VGDEDGGAAAAKAELEAEERRERAYTDADRTMMQIIQTSLSLIGFGFTLDTILQSAVLRGVAPAETSARHIGVALLALGLILLASGILNQVRHLRILANRYGRGRRWQSSAYHFGATPSILVAALLLSVGILALVTALRFGS
jgi:putative membrane protein